MIGNIRKNITKPFRLMKDKCCLHVLWGLGVVLFWTYPELLSPLGGGPGLLPQSRSRPGTCPPAPQVWAVLLLNTSPGSCLKATREGDPDPRNLRRNSHGERVAFRDGLMWKVMLRMESVSLGTTN